MSAQDSISGNGAKPKRPYRPKTYSASEISRNTKLFEIWSMYNRCEQVAFSDVPAGLQEPVQEVFDLEGRLPAAWADKGSDTYKKLKAVVPHEMLRWIQSAYKKCPELFSDDIRPGSSKTKTLFCELTAVYSAWKQLEVMKKSHEKWSEADYVTNVYDVLRSPALRASTHRAQCTLTLPQPLSYNRLTVKATQVLNAKMIIPDCSTFIPYSLIQDLSHAARSPYNVLRTHASMGQPTPSNGSETLGSDSCFQAQTTPCAQMPHTPGFEFVSSVWEDKKPVHAMLEDAYRQNRMACAGVVRHLDSLRVRAPVFGLVWATGVVRAHVDWAWRNEAMRLSVRSAPYPGPDEDNQDQALAHEWHLSEPSDIIQVFLLVRNIDDWTVGGFKDRVVEGVMDLMHFVTEEDGEWRPWKRVGTLTKPKPLNQVRGPNGARAENVVVSGSSAGNRPRRSGRRRSS